MSIGNRSTTDTLVDDLAFELSESDQPRVCIGVCDDVAEGEHLKHVIAKRLEREGVVPVLLRVSEKAIDIVELARSNSSRHKAFVFIVEGFEALKTATLQKSLARLNFRRDLFLGLSRPSLFWVTSRTLTSIVTLAPDFWSRRTRTYYFTKTTVGELLTKLFGKMGSVVAESRAARALGAVLVAENQLRSMNRRRTSPLLVDARIKNIRTGIKALIAEAKGNKSIEITLSLWTLTLMDERLRRLTLLVPRPVREKYEDLYEDRNDILLELANGIEGLLAKYAKRVEFTRQDGLRNGLLTIFAQTADREVWAWWRRISKYDRRWEKVSLDEVLGRVELMESTPPEEGIGGTDDYSPEVPVSEGEIRAVAVEELTGWLEGRKNVAPKIFTPEESETLRILYRESPDPRAVAAKLGRPIREVQQMLESLKGKVRAFLGSGP